MATKRERGRLVSSFDKKHDSEREERLQKLQAQVEKELPEAVAEEALELQMKIFEAQRARRQQERLRRQLKRSAG